MKRMPVLSVLLTLSILAGFLFLFPVEGVALLVLLVALIVFQVIVVRRHMRVTAPSRARGGGATALRKVARESRGPQVAAAGRATPDDGGGAAETPFDPAVFSRFRAHLDAAEQQPDAPPSLAAQHAEGAAAGQAAGSEPADPPAPIPNDSEDVRVVLSPAAKRKAAPRQAEAPRTPDGEDARTEEAGAEEDLFADLRTRPPEEPTAQAAPEGKGGRGGVGRRAAGKQKRAAAPPARGGKKDEAGAAERAPGRQGDSGEQALLLQLVEDALNNGDRAGAAAGLEQVLRAHADESEPVPWRVRLAQARLSVLDGNPQGALQDFEELLKWHPPLEESQYVTQIDQLASPVSGGPGADLRVSMLLKLLAVYRQANDRPAMDRIYALIEDAQEQTGDEQKLIQYYKNHLEIKTVLDDVEGQLALIDRIGNRYFKLGDTETARQFYEQGLKLRESQDAGSEEAGTPSP